MYRSFEKIRGIVERLPLAARTDNSITGGQKVQSVGAEEDGLVKLVLKTGSNSHLTASFLFMKCAPLAHSERGDFSSIRSKIKL